MERDSISFQGEEVHEDEVTRQILTRVDLKDNNGEKDHLDVRAAFVAIGHDPEHETIWRFIEDERPGLFGIKWWSGLPPS